MQAKQKSKARHNRLEPLEQWICDSCLRIIERPKDGMLEWLTRAPRWIEEGFKIVHHPTASQQQGRWGCYVHRDGGHDPGVNVLTDHLTNVVGPGVVPYFLRMVAPRWKKNFRPRFGRLLLEWTEVFRRLAIPYYEEARWSWGAAESAGFLQGMDDNVAYHPDTLVDILQRYGSNLPQPGG